MANIRIKSLPTDATPNKNDILAVDSLTTRGVTIENAVKIGRPFASQAEAEAGTDYTKAMNPLTTRQAIVAYGGAAFATAAQGTKADNAVQPGSLATVATSGAYGDLSGKPTLGTAAATAATDYATAAQGAKADAAVQPATLDAVKVPAGGSTGQVLAKSSNADNAVAWTAAGAGDMLKVNSLSDVASVPAARTNLRIADFDTVADAQASAFLVAPNQIRTAFYDTGQVPGSGAKYKKNGTTMGDLVITVAGASVGYTIDEPVVRASMFSRSAPDAITWLKPLLERGFRKVIVDAGTFQTAAPGTAIQLSANTHVVFEIGFKLEATLAGPAAEEMLYISTNSYDLVLEMDGSELDGKSKAPCGMLIMNLTGTYSKLRIDRPRVVNCKRTVANGQGCQPINIRGAFDRPEVNQPYVFNANRVAGGGTIGSVGTHGISIHYYQLGGDFLYPRSPIVRDPYIERILSEEAFSSDANQDCDCLRIFTHTGTEIGAVYDPDNAITVVGGTYRDFRGRALKLRGNRVNMVGDFKISVNGSVATGLKNAGFQIVSLQYGSTFNIGNIDIFMTGSGASDPFQGLRGGYPIIIYAPGDLGRPPYRGNINNVLIQFAGDAGSISGFDSIIQAGIESGTPVHSLLVNVNNVICAGQVNSVITIPPSVSSNRSVINLNNISVDGVLEAVIVAGGASPNTLMNVHLDNFGQTGAAIPLSRISGTSSPLTCALKQGTCVMGVSA